MLCGTDGLPCGSWYPKQTASQSSGSSDLWKLGRRVTLTTCSDMFQRVPIPQALLCQLHYLLATCNQVCSEESLLFTCVKNWLGLHLFEKALKRHHLQNFWSRLYLLILERLTWAVLPCNRSRKVNFPLWYCDQSDANVNSAPETATFRFVQSPVTWLLLCRSCPTGVWGCHSVADYWMCWMRKPQTRYTKLHRAKYIKIPWCLNCGGVLVNNTKLHKNDP